MYEDDDDYAPPARRDPADPLLVVGAAVALGIIGERGIQAWVYMAQFETFPGSNRLRTLATLLSPYPSFVLLIGVTLLRLRSMLGLPDNEYAAGTDRVRPMLLQVCGAVAALFAVASVVAAVDALWYDYDQAFFSMDRWQFALHYLLAGAIAAVAAWTTAGGLPISRRVVADSTSEG